MCLHFRLQKQQNVSLYPLYVHLLYPPHPSPAFTARKRTLYTPYLLPTVLAFTLLPASCCLPLYPPHSSPAVTAHCNILHTLSLHFLHSVIPTPSLACTYRFLTYALHFFPVSTACYHSLHTPILEHAACCHTLHTAHVHIHPAVTPPHTTSLHLQPAVLLITFLLCIYIQLSYPLHSFSAPTAC